ncbi:MAG: isoprenylcysteine carboxylmethyltransferase family protein [Bacteroidota bacterium]
MEGDTALGGWESGLILGLSVLIAVSGVFINVSKNESAGLKWQETSRSLTLFRILVPLALVLSLVCYGMGWGEYDSPKVLTVVGMILVPLGLWFRWWAVRTLGQYFTVKVSILDGHTLLQTGPYRRLRHPSYTGMLVYYTGLGLAMHNVVSLVVLVVLPLVAIVYRVVGEERALEGHFGQVYRDYRKYTWRLIPWIY